MADIDITDEVAHSREKVFTTFRDDLTELIPHLPDIKNITVKDRDQLDDQTIKVVNLWEAEAEEVPKVARSFIKPEMLKWTDYATWRKDAWECDWEMEVGFLTDAVTCEGTNRYRELADDRTEIHIDGKLEVDARQIPGVPRLGAGKIGNVVENFVVKLITPNLTNVNRGLERYLAEQGE